MNVQQGQRRSITVREFMKRLRLERKLWNREAYGDFTSGVLHGLNLAQRIVETNTELSDYVLLDQKEFESNGWEAIKLYASIKAALRAFVTGNRGLGVRILERATRKKV